MKQIKNIKSSKQHRNAERVNAVAEITGCALKSIHPIAELPCNIVQAINSGYYLFAPRMKPHERALQAIKGLIAAAQSVLLCVMLFKEETCSDMEANMCKTLLILDLIYQGILAIGWAPSEIFKDDCPTVNITNNINLNV